MSKSHKIKRVIKSTEKTAVITQAMELVSASKLPYALSALEATRGFSDLASCMVADYSQYTNLPHFQDNPDSKHHVIIVIGSDRGLCGSLNLNLFKQVIQKMKALEDEGKKVSLALAGSKTLQFFKDSAPVISQIDHLGDKPNAKDVMALMHPVIEAFEKRKVDCIHIANNKFINTLTQEPHVHQVLPKKVKKPTVDPDHYIYEPNQEDNIETLFRYYTESIIYRAVVENIACEQAARMMAMKNATDNAKDIIADLNLTYNKIRQALITQEIAEISAGALYADGENL